MAKKKRKKSEKIRNLKYGNLVSAKPKEAGVKSTTGNVKVVSEKSNDSKFKRELRRNLIFVSSFFAALLIIDILLTRTNLLNPILNLFGLSGLYKK